MYNVPFRLEMFRNTMFLQGHGSLEFRFAESIHCWSYASAGFHNHNIVDRLCLLSVLYGPSPIPYDPTETMSLGCRSSHRLP